MQYNEDIRYAVEAIRTIDVIDRDSSVLTDTPFIDLDDAKLFARRLSKYTGMALVWDQMRNRKVAEYKNGGKV